jgi:predicted Zn-dependent protease
LETDSDRRAYAAKLIEMFQADRARLNDPASRAPDYCDKEHWHIRWTQTSFPIRIFVEPGTGVRGYKESWASFIPSSLDAWCRASGNRLDYKIVHDAEDADIRVAFTTEDLQTTEEHPGVLPSGLTQYKPDDEHHLKVKVSVRTVSPFDNQHVFQDGEVAHICMHELGHALGLQHSTAMKDIMYFRSSDAESDGLTARDKATIASYYDDYPVIAFVPHGKVNNVPKFLPPPTFMPPNPNDLNKLLPPMFVPPPMQAENKKLKPPMFVPPPINARHVPSSHPAPPPAFLPPPVPNSKPKNPADGLFFTPPPK